MQGDNFPARVRAQEGQREGGVSAGSARECQAGLWEVSAEGLGRAEWRSGSVLGL